ncbi:MAG TPA: AAA family ATPase [Candidatus Tyrphobacter sp.]
MRFVQIHAKAFGPLADTDLELSPGMNVIGGLNGAGKSSWHNAIYAALCGIRRGPGLRKEDSEFAERYRPWTLPNWEVSAEISCDDGRTICIHRDLAENVDCSVCELPTGRDISAAFINDGSPDGARLVGLDRRTFLSTASVRQAEVTNLESGGELQQQLQRAAATAGEAATAAAAIEAIDNYMKEHVGLDRRNSTKPLRAAKDGLQRARDELATVEAKHIDYLKQLETVERLKSQADRAESESTAAEAVSARDQAHELRTNYSRAAELTQQFQSSPAPDLGADEKLASDVAAEIQTYEELVNQAPPSAGEDPGVLRSELSGLPKMPEGEIIPGRDVREAYEDYVSSLEGVDKMPDGDAVPTRAPSWWHVVGFASLIAAIVLLLAKLLALGAAALLVGSALLTFGFLRTRKRRDAERTRLRHAELPGLRNEPKAALSARLRSRGYQGDDPIGLYHRYAADCEERSEVALAAGRRRDLEKRLEAVEQLHALANNYAGSLVASQERLCALALRCGLEGSDSREVVRNLKSWQVSRSEQRKLMQKNIGERRELEALLGQGTLADLEREAVEKEREAKALATQFSGAKLEAWKAKNGSPSGAFIRTLRDEARKEKSGADTAEGELAQLKRSLPDVAASRDAVAAAELEHDRIGHLSKTLGATKTFLEKAQEAVFLDIAPMLVSTLEKWLPKITGGLYARAAVDPETLDVRVRPDGGAWRGATTLSHGTGEQVYLLLRIAMAEHLTKASNERCPLLLDEVTAHCDPVRTKAVLELLHEISKERQVVLFSQERDVAEWADKALREPNDKLIALDANALAL